MQTANFVKHEAFCLLSVRLPPLAKATSCAAGARADKHQSVTQFFCIVLQAYARMREECPDLVDLVAAGAASERENGAVELSTGKGPKRKRVYEDHRPMSDITAGIKRGILHQVPPRPCLLLAHRSGSEASPTPCHQHLSVLTI